MTFDEMRAEIGATRPAAVEGTGYYALPEMTLAELRDVLGQPLEQQTDPEGMAYVSFAVDGGQGAIIARSMGLAERLTDGIVFFSKRRRRSR